jgi:hypothetical protein
MGEYHGKTEKGDSNLTRAASSLEPSLVRTLSQVEKLRVGSSARTKGNLKVTFRVDKSLRSQKCQSKNPTHPSKICSLEMVPGVTVLRIHLRVYSVLPLTRTICVRPPNSRIFHPKRHELEGWTVCLQFRSKSALATRHYWTRLPLRHIKLDAFEIMHSHEILEDVMSLGGGVSVIQA